MKCNRTGPPCSVTVEL